MQGNTVLMNMVPELNQQSKRDTRCQIVCESWQAGICAQSEHETIYLHNFLPPSHPPPCPPRSECLIIIKEWNCVISYQPSYLHIFVNRLVSNWLLFNFRFLSPRIPSANKNEANAIQLLHPLYVSSGGRGILLGIKCGFNSMGIPRTAYTIDVERRNPMIRK